MTAASVVLAVPVASEGDGMPSGPRESITPEMLRELLEEIRHSTTEGAGLHAGMERLQGTMEELVRAVRGGNGNPGLTSITAVIEQRVRQLETTLAQMNAAGTPAGRTEIAALHGDVSTLRVELLPLTVHQQELERRLNTVERQREGGINRTWQVALFAATSILSLAGLGVAAIALFVKR